MPVPFQLPTIKQSGISALLRGLASNSAAPPDVLLRLAAADSVRFLLARRRDLPADVATLLARDRDANVRGELAAHPTLPPEAQSLLAVDVDPQVRARLAQGADFFTTVGVHGRQIPGPLTRESYEVLAEDPDPKVRRALAFNRHLPNAVRTALLDDPDTRTASIAASEWAAAPADRIGELFARVPGTLGRQLLLLRLSGPLPTQTARTLLADIDAAPKDEGHTALLEQVVAVAELDAELTDRFLADPQLLAAVAANPTLPTARAALLAHHPDNEVRAAVVARRGLDPALRESIPVDYDERGSGTVGWLLDDELTEARQLAFARSRHQIFRKTLALRPGLSDETIAILARDESFAVRLFVCERQPNAPGWLLAQTAAQWSSYSRWDIIAHKNYPAKAATGLARSDQPRERAAGAAHPGLSAELIETLLDDENADVRRCAAANPALPINQLIELLSVCNSAVAAGVGGNPMLPAPAMRLVLDQAGL